MLSGGQSPVPLLTSVLLYHVAPESLQASQVLGAGSIETLLGVDLGVVGTKLVDRDPDVQNPSLIATDTQAANGVVHVIDGVLLPVNLLKSNGANDVDFIIANNNANLIFTGLDNDFVDGIGGGDIIHAGSGNDVILGGTGGDRIFGDSGNDLLRGDAGADIILGSAGNDIITGGAGSDTLGGGSGADVFVFEIGSQRDIVIDFRNGQDRIDLTDQSYTSFAMLQAYADITQTPFWHDHRLWRWRADRSDRRQGQPTRQFRFHFCLSKNGSGTTLPDPSFANATRHPAAWSGSIPIAGHRPTARQHRR